MKVIKPPTELPIKDLRLKIFLAGSIEMGVAEDWQKKLEKKLSKFDVIIYNPRRDDWDSTWKQSIDEPKFVEQVNWELDALDDADLILLYLQPDTKSPISLLELGLHAAHKNLIVCCPEGFWRKGNVDIVSDRYKLQAVDTLDELIDAVVERCERDL